MNTPLESSARKVRLYRAPLWGSPRLYSRGESVSARYADGRYLAASRFRARVARVGIRAMLAIGFGAIEQPMLDELDSALESWLRGLAPRADRVVYIVGRSGVCGKVVVVPVTAQGRALAFTKAAWGKRAVPLLKREAGLLPLAAAEGIGPSLIGIHEAHGVFALMSEVLPGREPRLIDPVPRELLQRAMVPANSLPADQHPAVLECAARWPEIAPRLQTMLSGMQYAVGLTHGDAAPWNARVVDKVTRMFDWEYGTQDGLVVTDVAHWMLQTSHLVARRGPVRACDMAAGSLVTEIGLTPMQARGVCLITALGLCYRLRSEEKRSEAAWWEAIARRALAEPTP